MTTVRELVAVLGLDFDGSGFNKAEGAMKSLKSGLAGVAAVVTGTFAAVAGVTVSMAKQADELGDLAVTLGVTTDGLQKLGYAAQMSGSDAATLQAGLSFLARSASAASDGNKEMAATFGRLGVKLKDSSGNLRSTDALLLDMAGSLDKVKSPTERAALAADLLGRSAGPRLQQFLAQGREGIEALGKELEELGGLMDEGFIESSGEMNDNLDRMNVVVRSVGLTIARSFLPTLRTLTSGMVGWWRANRQVIEQRLTTVIDSIGSAFEGVLGVGKVFMSGFEAIGKTFGGFSRTAQFVIASLVAIGAAMLLPFGPTILLSGIILALLDDFNQFVTGGESLLGDFTDWLKSWGHNTGGVFGWVAEQIANFLNHFRGAGWEEVANAFVRVWRHATDSVLGFFRDVADAWTNAKNFIAGIPTSVATTVKNIVRSDDALFPSSVEKISGAVSAASSQGSTTSKSTTVNASITVNGAGDPNAVASAIDKKLREREEQAVIEDRAALIPAGAR